MGLFIKNNFFVGDNIFQYALIHLMPNGIRLEFDNSEQVLINVLKRVGGDKFLSNDWKVNTKPIQYFSIVITKTFSVNNGDGINWIDSSFSILVKGDQITTSIYPVVDQESLKWINCKRFMQIVSGVFEFVIPKEIEMTLIDEIKRMDLLSRWHSSDIQGIHYLAVPTCDIDSENCEIIPML